MTRTKRLLYAPGIISLIGLSISLPLFYEKHSVTKEYCLTLFTPSDEPDKSSSIYSYSKYSLEKDIRKMKKINFSLDSNTEENKRKMNMIRYEALKLKYTEDTSTVVLINFTDSINYGEFVSIVDLCYADGHTRFAPWDNKFVIFGEWPRMKIKESNTITPLYCGTKSYKIPDQKPGFIDSIIKKVTSFYSPQGLYLIIGFLVLAISYFVSIKLTRPNIEEILS